MNEQINRVVSSFKYDGEPYSVLPHGNGHINSTFKVECKILLFIFCKIYRVTLLPFLHSTLNVEFI